MPNEENQVSELIAAQSSESTYVVVDIANGEEGAEVITYAAKGSDNQRWVFTPIETP